MVGVKRYWLYFDTIELYPFGLPPVIGVTGRSVHDCLAIAAHWYGQPLPPLVKAVEQPDLSDGWAVGVPGGWSRGVPVWRGVWYPPNNLAGPEPEEFQRADPRWWSLSGHEDGLQDRP
jgi:hypothetical protein